MCQFACSFECSEFRAFFHYKKSVSSFVTSDDSVSVLFPAQIDEAEAQCRVIFFLVVWVFLVGASLN